MRYRLTLTHDAATPDAPQRWVNRNNVDEAVDSARRWLRLKRNTTPKAMDLHTTYIVETPTAGDSFRVVATGRFDD